MSGTYLHLSVRKIVVSHSVDVCLQQTRLKEVTNHQKEKKKRPTAIMTWNKCMGSWTHVGFVGKSPSAEVVAACGELPSPKYEDAIIMHRPSESYQTKFFLLVRLETRRLSLDSLLCQMNKDGICLIFFF